MNYLTVKQFKDMTALEIEVKGKSVPLSVVLHPYAVYSPGQNLVGTTIKKLVTVSVILSSLINFHWTPINYEFRGWVYS